MWYLIDGDNNDDDDGDNINYDEVKPIPFHLLNSLVKRSMC